MYVVHTRVLRIPHASHERRELGTHISPQLRAWMNGVCVCVCIFSLFTIHYVNKWTVWRHIQSTRCACEHVHTHVWRLANTYTCVHVRHWNARHAYRGTLAHIQAGKKEIYGRLSSAITHVWDICNMLYSNWKLYCQGTVRHIIALNICIWPQYFRVYVRHRVSTFSRSYSPMNIFVVLVSSIRS